MKLSKDEFRNLQREWYQKLKDIGFKDIEKLHGDELLLIQSASRSIDMCTLLVSEEYYRNIGQKALDEDTEFRNEVHKHILVRHSEGAKIKTIISELNERGLSRTKESVRVIIRRYEMKWGIRTYTEKQLRKY